MINFDEYKSIETHLIALHVNGDKLKSSWQIHVYIIEANGSIIGEY